MTADLSKDTHPEVHRIIHKNLYADDCISGNQTEDDAHENADGMEEVLSKGGYHLKGFTFSGKLSNP